MNYIILITVPTFFYFLDEFFNTKPRVFEKIGIVFLIILSSLRMNVGVDYFTYRAAYERMQQGYFMDDFDIGYLFLSKLSLLIGLDFSGLLLIIATMNGILLYLALKKNIFHHRWLALFFYLSYFDLFVYSLSAIRQSIAMNIIIFSIMYIYENKFLNFLLAILIASLFHWTAIMIFPMYFVYKIFLKTDLKKSMMYFTLSIPIYFFIVEGLKFLTPYLSYRFYYYLFIEDANIQKNIKMSIVYYLLLICWQLYIYKYKSDTYRKNNEKYLKILNISLINIPEIAISIFIVLKICQSLLYFGALPRLQMYFYCFIPFAAISAIGRLKKELRIFVSIILILVFVYFFYIKLQANYEYYGNFRLNI